MSEVRKRKIHGPKLNAKVGLEAARGVKTINEIAEEMGVHLVQVGQYRKQILVLLASPSWERKKCQRFLRFKTDDAIRMCFTDWMLACDVKSRQKLVI